MMAPDELVTNKEREVLDWVVTRFLSERKATSRRSLVHSFEDPGLIDSMLKRSLLVEADRHLYLPSVLAFEFCGLPDARESARNAAAIVVKTLQHLYRSDENKIEFTFSEIKERASDILGIKDDEAIWLGLYIIRELNILDTYSWKIEGIETNTVRPSEDIVLVKDFRAPWDKTVNDRTAYWLPEGQVPARYFSSVTHAAIEKVTNAERPKIMFNQFLNERITLVKKTGERFENLPASVQSNFVFTQDPKIPIEDGDHFERQLASGVIEAYLVLDAGFNQGLGGIKPHYQTKVRKVDISQVEAHANAKSGSLTAAPNSIDVFISHSSADADLAKEVIDLLRVALPIDPKRIRCTSVDGYRLEGGADANDQIRTEIWGASIFLGLLTPTSLSSTYVLFELGARWGARRQLKPLLAAGMQPGALRAPLSSLNALSCDHEAQILQLIREIGDNLGVRPHDVDSYLANAKALANRSLSMRADVGPRRVPVFESAAADKVSNVSSLELVIVPFFVKFTQPGLAEFQITAKLWNRGAEVIRDYHLDVQVPAKLLDNNSATFWQELPERRTTESRFFRFPSPDARPAAVYPDDQKPIGTLTFYLDSVQRADLDLRRRTYLATLYAGTQKIIASKTIEELLTSIKLDDLFPRA